MNPNGPGDQMNNKSGGDILTTMIGGSIILFLLFWAFTEIFS